MIKEAIASLVSGQSLNRAEAATAMAEIMGGEATPAQIGAFLTALRIKGETTDELVGFASVMREKVLAVPLPANLNIPVIDVVGTGGDGANTFNISTTSAFVVAGAGVVVAKHGNRAASSRCGSADVLEALGVNINLTPEQVTACISQVGIGFMFAPLFHPSMKYAAPVRRELGFRTVFNLLGPLTNPAGAQRHLMGVASRPLAAQLAQVLHELGAVHSLVVNSADGLDEISLAAETYVYQVKAGQPVTEHQITPEELGLPRLLPAQMKGGSPEDNCLITLSILEGQPVPQRAVILLNAAAALVAADVAPDYQAGLVMAAQSIDSGAALAKLRQLAGVSSSFAVEQYAR